MSKDRARALIYNTLRTDDRKLETLPKDIHDAARTSLIRLFRDSLNLNDKIKYELPTDRECIESEIVDDFQMVADYIQYLLLQLNRKDVILGD